MSKRIITAHIQTPNAARYIKRLCKHFAHKVDATYTEDSGFVTFPFGTCDMKATTDVLVLKIEAGGEAKLERTRVVLEKHL